MLLNGLTSIQAQQQKEQGNINLIPEQSDRSVKQIIRSNLCTYFNLIFLIISILLILAGSFRSLTFLPVVIANTVIGIFQQLRSKKVLDALSVLDKTNYTVIRDQKEIILPSDELVLNDIVFVKSGQQIPADGIVMDGKADVNESLLTGEADEIEKIAGSELKSGSFVVSGEVYMKLTSVGVNSYACKLMAKAKKVTDNKSEMIRDIELIIKIAGILIIPIGLLLFIQSFMNGNGFSDSIVSMVGAVIGMIPEGMYLLTTVALALSSMRLAQKQVLLHDMHSIETLARVDVLCVDKTGTITEDKMSVIEVFPPANQNDTSYSTTLSKYIHTFNDSNITMEALKNYFKEEGKLSFIECHPFTSKTKYSSIQTETCEYKLGAPEYLLSSEQLNENSKRISHRTSMGQRVLAFVEYQNDVCTPLLFIALENKIRDNAKEIFAYFHDRNVEVKVISGDHPQTVSKIAMNAGIVNADKYVDATTLTTMESIQNAVSHYTVFGRVKPEQKQQIVKALQNNKLKVAMTGDGVNDILAMKKADCSIAMGSGSDAARQAAQVVLLDSNFSHLNDIVSEGRRDINNITRSATLFLYKNMFSLFLALFSIINSFSYPLKPSQISLVSMFNIGIPSFFLALEANEDKQSGHFIAQTVLRALPASLTSFVSIAALVVFAQMFHLPDSDIGTASTYLLSIVGFIILIHLSSPFNKYRGIVFTCCLAGFLLSLTWLNELFAIEALSFKTASLCVVFALAEVTVMRYLTKLFTNIRKFIEKKCNKA
mgnify:FL=1